MRTLIAGNWKMHGLQAQLGTIDAVSAFVAEQPIAADVLVCPHATQMLRDAGAAAVIRGCLFGRFGEAAKTMRILYGGSVKPENARAILALPEVGGALVGGASLDAVDFEGIVRALMR